MWLVFVLLSARLGHSELAATNNAAPAEIRKLATGNPGFLSIDCGVDEDYVDKETGIFYKSDRDFISTGENKDVSPEYASDVPSFGRVLNNMRIFPEGRRNCYTLRPEQGKNHNYLIRAFFKYGNYDARNQTPRFDLYLGADYWTTEQQQDASAWNSEEVIHFSVTETIYVCLVNSGSGIPYISELELRLLDDSTYKSEFGLSFVYGRYNLGYPTNMSARYEDLIHRYEDDVFDRMWMSGQPPEWVAVNTTSNVNISSSSSDSYKLPQEVLRAAIEPKRGIRRLNTTITLYSAYPSTYSYVYFHFAEIVQTSPGQRREFTITVNGITDGPISLEYLEPKTIVSPKLPLQGSGYIDFFINSTMRSNLPPILNAFEILITLPPVSPTNLADADAIMAIKQTYKINKVDWQGDPCVPPALSWSGLNCNNDMSPPRIISLNLSSSKLKGRITSSLSNLTAIQSLDLSYNELTETVPEFLSLLPSLTVLNLKGNKFTGSIPRSLMEKSNNGTLELSLDGNPNLCLTDSCLEKKQNFLVPIIASCVSIVAFLLICTIAIIWGMKKFGVTQSRNQSLVRSKNLPFKYSEIVRMTNNFNSIIGEGGFGKVYLGNLEDGTQVAVKLLSQSSKQGYKEFRSEVQLLMVVHHRNLVALIGYCDEHDNRALVYEYMANGNLQQNLSDTCTNVLNWRQRLQIAVDAAYGLEYLHNGCKPPIIHRDLKTSNILLNKRMQAKISDFGLSRAFESERDSHVSTRPAGTPGYLGPEFRASGNLNKKSDVYSFGILLFELITGQPAIRIGHDQNIHILQWVSPIIEKGDIRSIVDLRLQGKFSINSAWKAVETAMSCVSPTAVRRPDISHVLVELKECLAMEITSASMQIPDGNLRFCNSLDVCLELETDMAPSPR